jgi:hypothetical protein
MPFTSSGAISIGDARTYFIAGGAPQATSMSDFYRGNFIPDVSQNSGIPTSGAISMGNLYGGYAQRVGFSLNILPYRTPTQDIFGYWTSVGVIGGGAQGTIDSIAIGSNPYTDGRGTSVTLNSAVWNWPSQPNAFTLQLSDTTDTDLKFWRVSVLGGFVNTTLYRSGAAATGAGIGGRTWSWNISNPFTVGNPTVITVDYIT